MSGPALALKGVLFGWGAFCGSHLMMSHEPVREWLHARLGKNGFNTTYNAVSIGTLAPTLYAYMIGRGRGPKVHHIGDTTAGQLTGAAIKWAGFFTLAQGYINPSPSSWMKRDEHQGTNEDIEVTGIHRITRHPVFAGAAMWGLGCMLQRGHMIDLVFWGAFPALYLIGGYHQDMRNENKYSRHYWQNTSLLPFGAVLSGRQSASQAYDEISSLSLRLTFYAGILALALRGRLRRGFWLPHRLYKAW